jgi:2-polyprenyl-3-methyl-5-hydroxy-6-metoxy-1,4-benzoquinol methylase
MIPVTSCAMCGGRDLHPFAFSAWQTGSLHFAQVRCVSCGLIISQPRATSDEIERYYADTYYREHWPDADTLVPESQRNYTRHEWPLMQELWRDWPPPADASLVEVGCGYGAFLGLMMQHGFRAAGCDLSHDAVKSCRGRGLHVLQGSVPGTAFGRQFDWSIAQHVIEHVEDPRAFVGALAALVRPGGLIVIVTEDSWSAQFGWRSFRSRLRGHIPAFHTSTDHTFIFSAHHLAQLLADAGCDEVRTRSFSYRGSGESLHWRLYKTTLRIVDRLLGRGDYLMAVGRVAAASRSHPALSAG